MSIPPEKWFFHLEGETVVLQSRVESDDGTIVGDAFSEIEPGGKLLNLSYEQLAAAGAGVVEIENNQARITGRAR
jgi:hypothetical protein